MSRIGLPCGQTASCAATRAWWRGRSTDNAARAGDSSSPSGSRPGDDSVLVESVSLHGNAVRILLADGSSLDLPPEAVTRFSIEAGGSLSADAIRLVREEAEVREAAARALLLLARSQHTLRDLRLKLERRGYSPGAIRRVLERLEELGYLDDARAAGTWVEHRLERHPEGRASLLAWLERHGVSRETAEHAVDAHLPLHAEEEVARRALRKLYPSEEARERLAGGPERDRAMRRLLARGFSRAAARKALPGGAADEDWSPEE